MLRFPRGDETARGRGTSPGLVVVVGVIVALLPLFTACGFPGDGGEDEGPRLLFLDGRATTYLGEGRVAWPDQEGARVLLFDPSGGVERIYQGAPEDGPPLSDPVVVARVPGGLAVFQRDGSALRFDTEGRAEAWLPSPASSPVIAAGPGGRLAVAHSVLYFPLSPLAPEAPLLWLMPALGEDPIPLGEARPTEEPRLGPLANAGWAAFHPRGELYFASALRPELVRLDPEEGEVWRRSWSFESTEHSDESRRREPSFQVVNGQLRPEFRVLQHAVAVGPDERVYVLAAPEDSGRPDLLLVFDREGALVDRHRVAAGEAVFVDPGGRIHTEDPAEALSRSAGRDRAAFRPFDLPSLSEADRVRLEDHAGKVVVVNFWASWCPPCRKELPLLDELHRELDPDEAVVIGLNEDARPGSGREFLAELGGVSFPVGQGEGRLRGEYGYRGLPYTVVLDREHRVRRVFFGFGETLEPIRREVMEALAEPVLP